MTKKVFNISATALILFLALFTSVFAKTDGILSPEEELWLKSRNNTIVVYPEKGFPPFSYQSTSGTPEGLSIDYIELIAEKIGAKISYLPARPLSQILDDVKSGKADVITSITDTKNKDDFLYFTDNYITVPTVIVVRKDFNDKTSMTVSDLTGMKVAVGDGYAVSEFLSKNYPRIVLEKVTDDEVGLQKLVLGEVDAAVMDVTSLSFYLSKQVLSSVKISGDLGFEYKLAFAVPKDKQILQSILDKGLTQISKNDRQILNEKWVSIYKEESKNSFYNSFINSVTRENIYIALIFLLVIILILSFKRGSVHSRFFRKKKNVEILKEEIEELGEMNEILSGELDKVKKEEDLLKNKLNVIER